jgi:elongation factor 1-beta
LAQVIVTLRVLPESPQVDLDRLEARLTELVKPERIDREPIAFGLVALKVVKLVPDAAGEVAKLEKNIKSIRHVGQVDVIEVTRSL